MRRDYPGVRESKVPMTMTAQFGRYAQFMGFRDCPACGATLFAAEHAEFVCTDRITLRWRCDACDHAFQTSADLARRAPRRLAQCR